MKAIRKNSETIISRSEQVERYMKDIRSAPLLTYEEQRQLIKEAQAGDHHAANKLVVSNLRFVVNVAKEYQTKGIDIMDLISAGNLGMYEAIEKFNLKKEIRFISYAVWWIRNCIIEYLKENGKPIRLPFNKQEDISRLDKKKERLEQSLEIALGYDQVLQCDEEEIKSIFFGKSKDELRKKPLNSKIQAVLKNDKLGKSDKMRALFDLGIRTPNEIKKYIKAHPSFIHQVIAKHKTTIKPERVLENNEGTQIANIDISDLNQALICNATVASLDTPISEEDNETTLGDMLSDEASNPLAEYENEHRKRLVASALKRLSTTQQRVLSLSFGLEDNIIRSNEDIAEYLDLTAERVRQIKNISLRKLKRFGELQKCF